VKLRLQITKDINLLTYFNVGGNIKLIFYFLNYIYNITFQKQKLQHKSMTLVLRLPIEETNPTTRYKSSKRLVHNDL
jgi:hypothetical protein